MDPFQIVIRRGGLDLDLNPSVKCWIATSLIVMFQFTLKKRLHYFDLVFFWKKSQFSIQFDKSNHN
jgi:hypothetical protein